MKFVSTIPNIAFYSKKGGVGKTTLSFHGADAFAMKGYNTALLDLDPQGSTTTLSELNDKALESGETTEKGFLFDSYADSKEMGALQASPKQWSHIIDSLAKAGHDLVVAEYGPGIPGAALGKRHDLVVVPMQPCQTDYIAALHGVQSLPKDVPVIAVLNRYKASSPSHQLFYTMAQEAFGADNVLVVQEATVFQTCNNLGRSVYTLTERPYGLSKAKGSMDLLVERILGRLGLPLDKTN